MRGDMGGAASVVSAAWAIASLKLPINLVVLTPLCENMPGPSATKPGDVYVASCLHIYWLLSEVLICRHYLQHLRHERKER